jgi:hypothetical protein
MLSFDHVLMFCCSERTFKPNALSLDINYFLEIGLILGIFIKQLGENS